VFRREVRSLPLLPARLIRLPTFFLNFGSVSSRFISSPESYRVPFFFFTVSFFFPQASVVAWFYPLETAF